MVSYVAVFANWWIQWWLALRKNSKARLDLSMLGVGRSTLVLDLAQRGMLDDVLIVVWGELGRTPGSNASVGRDHWSPAASVWLSGEGIQTGQVVGATDPHGGEPTDRPVPYRKISTTLYHPLGLDPYQLVLDYPESRPYDLFGWRQANQRVDLSLKNSNPLDTPLVREPWENATCFL